MSLYDNDGRLARTFALIEEYVTDSGGDGDAWIVCPDYTGVAKAFALWSRSNRKGWHTEHEIVNGSFVASGQISFHRPPEEEVTFLPSRENIPSWAELIIESHFYEDMRHASVKQEDENTGWEKE